MRFGLLLLLLLPVTAVVTYCTYQWCSNFVGNEANKLTLHLEDYFLLIRLSPHEIIVQEKKERTKDNSSDERHTNGQRTLGMELTKVIGIECQCINDGIWSIG